MQNVEKLNPAKKKNLFKALEVAVLEAKPTPWPAALRKAGIDALAGTLDAPAPPDRTPLLLYPPADARAR